MGQAREVFRPHPCGSHRPGARSPGLRRPGKSGRDQPQAQAGHRSDRHQDHGGRETRRGGPANPGGGRPARWDRADRICSSGLRLLDAGALDRGRKDSRAGCRPRPLRGHAGRSTVRRRRRHIRKVAGLMKIDFKGLFPATVLPMTSDAQIDEPSLRHYMRHIAQTTIHGVAINVDTGEAPHLTHEERVRVIEIVVDEIGDRLPVIAGLPAQFTDQAVAYGRDYEAAGASALLVFPISAYQGSPLDPEVVVRYHAAVGDGVGLPLVLFNLLPSLGGVLLPAEIIERLCGLASVVAIKDASFDARVFVEVLPAVREQSRPVAILTGDDPFIYESFVLGAEGALLGFGAVPARQLAQMV